MTRRATTRPVPVPVADPALWPAEARHWPAGNTEDNPRLREAGPTGDPDTGSDEGSVLIDCDTCTARGPGCPDCVVSVLLGMPAPRLRIESSQVQALGVLARSGLVPPLRHDRVG